MAYFLSNERDKDVADAIGDIRNIYVNVPSLWPRLAGITIQMIIAVHTMDRLKIWSFPRQPILTKSERRRS
jgi:hypothetical protein